MRKLFLLILILASNLFAQGWNDIVTTNIGEPQRQDIFTNSSGIHILVKALNTNIVYYKLNSEGNVDPSKTKTFETSGDFPNIIGSNDKIYAIYKTGNNIRIKYSTDNGSSWLTNISDRPTTANDCNGVDAVYNDQGVHIVWATKDYNNGAGYETYFRRLAPDNSWADAEYKNVTDFNDQDRGGNPNVVVSPNRVHISFNTDAAGNPGDVKTRDKYYSNWEEPQTVVTGSSEQSLDERLLVREGYLYLFYSRDDPASYPNDLRFRTRKADNSTTWSDFTTLVSGSLYQIKDAFEITKTTNDYIQVIYKRRQDLVFAYTYFDGINWIPPDILDDNANVRPIGLISTSNDFFLTWVKQGTSYLRYRQYDEAPAAPQNLAITINSSDETVLTWVPNNEPDVRTTNGKYKIYRAETDLNGNILPYQLAATINASNGTTPVTSWTDADAMKSAVRKLYYKITAMDIKQHESLFSNIVWRFGRLGKTISQDIYNFEYSLCDNYPNPFNPSTKISYSIKEYGFVTIKVYDILGKEVTTLVHENKSEGNYEVDFDASQLQSGMYIYSIRSGDFKKSKKMLFMK